MPLLLRMKPSCVILFFTCSTQLCVSGCQATLGRWQPQLNTGKRQRARLAAPYPSGACRLGLGFHAPCDHKYSHIRPTFCCTCHADTLKQGAASLQYAAHAAQTSLLWALPEHASQGHLVVVLIGVEDDDRVGQHIHGVRVGKHALPLFVVVPAKALHDAVDLLRLPRQPEALQVHADGCVKAQACTGSSHPGGNTS